MAGSEEERSRQSVADLLTAGVTAQSSTVHQTLAAFAEVVDGIILETALEVHRAARLDMQRASAAQEDDDDDDDAANGRNGSDANGRGDSGRPRQDMYGQTFSAVCSEEVTCPRCGNVCAAGRFANHLGKCYAKGRAASRKGGAAAVTATIASSAPSTIALSVASAPNASNARVSTSGGGPGAASRPTLMEGGGGALEAGVFDLPSGPLSLNLKGARTKKKKQTVKIKPPRPKADRSGKTAAQSNSTASGNPLFMLGNPGDADFLDASPLALVKESDFLKDIAMMDSDPNGFQIGTLLTNTCMHMSTLCYSFK